MRLDLKARGAILKLFKYWAPSVINVEIKNLTSSDYDPRVQEVVNVYESGTFPAIKSSFEDRDVDGVKIARQDFKLMLKRWEIPFNIDEESECFIDGERYDIIRSKAQMHNQVFILHVRRP